MCMKLCMCVADRTNVFINLTQEQEQGGKYQKKYLRHRPASVVFVEWRAR